MMSLIPIKPWIKPKNTAVDDIANVFERCPTGALHYEVKSVDRTEKPSAKNRIKLQKDGPLLLEGIYILELSEIGELTSSKNIALCRCGGSSNKPFCDGKHKEIGFTA